MDPPRASKPHFCCSICGTSFGRAEHLSRHQLSHTNTKPFTCPVCYKGFTRRDTLNRHLPIHSASVGKDRPARDMTASRTSQACNNCARLRLRCDGQPYCARCQSKQVPCVYSARTRRRVAIIQDASLLEPSGAASAGESTAVFEADSIAPEPLRQSAPDGCGPPNMSLASPMVPAMTPASPNNPHGPETGALPQPQQHSPRDEHHHVQLVLASTPNSLPASNEVSAGEPMQPGSTDHVYSMPTSSMSTGSLSQCEMQTYNEFDLDWTWDENPSLIDWMTFSSRPDDAIFSLVGQSTPKFDFNSARFDHPMPEYSDIRHHHSSARPSVLPEVGLGEGNQTTHGSDFSKTQGSSSNAHQWPMDWNPVRSDNLVTFPDMSSASIDIVEAENFAHVEPLSQQSYEDMRELLKRTSFNQTQYRPFQHPTLPPIHVMDCFLQLYFEYFHPIFPMLHKASFDPCKVPWQVCLALCAIGARYSKLSSSSQCSNALQELLRRAIAETVENDNSLVRELWATQTMILNSIGMMYSGNKRFFEVAEAVRNSPAIQCRRNASTKATGTSVAINVNCSGRSLETSWRQWIHEESRRRLGFSAFLMDAQVVLYLDVNPCLSASEMRQQLPCSENIWNAPTAEAWKEQYLHHASANVPTVQLAMEQLRQGKSISPAVGDFARLVLVFATYLEAAAANKISTNYLLADERIADSVVEEANRTALIIFETLKAEARHDGDLPLRSSLNCHIHLALMLLFTPRTEIVNYAHSFRTELKVVGARGRLRRWVERDAGRHARHAIAAAGALTGLLQPNSTLGFYEPIAALLAILTLWTYSQMVEQSAVNSASAGTVDRTGSGGRVVTVRLDNFREAWRVREWVDGLEGLRPHIKDVGNICRSSAGSRILSIGKDMVAGGSAWLLSHGFSVWLSKLRARADNYDSMVD